MLFINLVQANLKTRILGQQIEYYTRLESTNSEAWEIIDEGAQSGALIVTDNQFSGKGRADRKWSAAPNKSLTFSLLLFPDFDANLSGWLPILSGLAVQKALLNFDTDVRLKWPNDLILDGKKVGGILCESKVKGNKLNQAVIGIGLNVNEARDDFDPSIQSTATSLHMTSKKFYQRERVLRSEEHTSELQSQAYLVCRLLLEKKKQEKKKKKSNSPTQNKHKPLIHTTHPTRT